MMFRGSPSLLPLCVLLATAVPGRGAPPPFTGALLPAPDLAASEAFEAVMVNLASLLDNAIDSSANTSGFDPNQTSFSIAVTSERSPANAPVLWEYHHLASNRSENSTTEINGESTYMLASNTKVFTSLLMLKSGIELSAPVTDFLTELADHNLDDRGRSTIQWSEITIGDLMTHLSGIPQVYGFPEIYQLVPVYEALGFPPLDTGNFPPCGIIGLNEGCNDTTLLPALLKTAMPIVSPGHTPVYGTLSFVLLGMVLERHTGRPYADLLQSDVLDPLNMTASGIAGSFASPNAIIPAFPSTWGSDFGINAPGSGFLSCTSDMSKFLHSILSKSASILSSPADIDHWLKPAAFLPTDIGAAVGAPWEIYRVPAGVLTSTPGSQGVDIYAKDGSLLGYYSRMMLVPAFGLGITVLTASEDTVALELVSEAVLAEVVRAAEEVALRQANETYTGIYAVQGGDVDSNLTLVLDYGPGIKLEGLYRNGSDILAAFQGIFAESVVGGGTLSDDWRIYPTGLVTAVEDDGQESMLEDWRIGFSTTRQEAGQSRLAGVGQGVFRNADSAWLRIDGTIVYGGRPADRIVFKRGQDGIVQSVWLPALRTEMVRLD